MVGVYVYVSLAIIVPVVTYITGKHFEKIGNKK